MLISKWAVLLVIVPIIACGGNATSSEGITIEPVATATIAASQAPIATSEPDLTGFILPIAGACLPKGNQLMPNAPRTYRNGIHEGIDLYESDNCTRIGRGTSVMAAKAGIVVRADVNYAELTPAELARLNSNPTSSETVDKFRGRQVWIDHGAGVVTRYAHLLSIAPGITPGKRVTQGQLIAFVGESGTPESVEAPGTDNHLHFEVRVGDAFLGQGRGQADVRALYADLLKVR